MHLCVFGCSSDVLWNSRGFNSYLSIVVAAIPFCDLLGRVSWRTSPWTGLHLGWKQVEFLPYYFMPSMNIVCLPAWMWVFCMVWGNLKSMVSRNLDFVYNYLYITYIWYIHIIYLFLEIDISHENSLSRSLSKNFLGRCADLPQPNRRTNTAEIAMIVCSRNVLTIPLDIYILHPQFPNQGFFFGKISNDSICFCCAANLFEDTLHNRVNSNQRPSQPDLLWKR